MVSVGQHAVCCSLQGSVCSSRRTRRPAPSSCRPSSRPRRRPWPGPPCSASIRVGNCSSVPRSRPTIQRQWVSPSKRVATSMFSRRSSTVLLNYTPPPRVFTQLCEINTMFKCVHCRKCAMGDSSSLRSHSK